MLLELALKDFVRGFLAFTLVGTYIIELGYSFSALRL
jgi:hypothetical protein